ncbi:BUD13 homolog, partial [Centroberyx affinis]|uniref:BUD13 homolog n=1 Tax=Centroberyx affinis TaxID=166261 RepID=UPI003A5BA1E4
GRGSSRRRPAAGSDPLRTGRQDDGLPKRRTEPDRSPAGPPRAAGRLRQEEDSRPQQRRREEGVSGDGRRPRSDRRAGRDGSSPAEPAGAAEPNDGRESSEEPKRRRTVEPLAAERDRRLRLQSASGHQVHAPKQNSRRIERLPASTNCPSHPPAPGRRSGELERPPRQQDPGHERRRQESLAGDERFSPASRSPASPAARRSLPPRSPRGPSLLPPPSRPAPVRLRVLRPALRLRRRTFGHQEALRQHRKRFHRRRSAAE